MRALIRTKNAKSLPRTLVFMNTPGKTVAATTTTCSPIARFAIYNITYALTSSSYLPWKDVLGQKGMH